MISPTRKTTLPSTPPRSTYTAAEFAFMMPRIRIPAMYDRNASLATTGGAFFSDDGAPSVAPRTTPGATVANTQKAAAQRRPARKGEDFITVRSWDQVTSGVGTRKLSKGKIPARGSRIRFPPVRSEVGRPLRGRWIAGGLQAFVRNQQTRLRLRLRSLRPETGRRFAGARIGPLAGPVDFVFHSATRHRRLAE